MYIHTWQIISIIVSVVIKAISRRFLLRSDITLFLAQRIAEAETIKGCVRLDLSDCSQKCCCQG